MTQSQSNIYKKILEAANIIHKQAIRGSANYVVCSPQTTTALKNANFPWSKNVYRMEKIKKMFL